MKVECRHISANANPKPNSLLFLDSYRLVYAFSNQVALYNVESRQVLFTIHGTYHSTQTLRSSKAAPIASPSCNEQMVTFWSADTILDGWWDTQ